MKKQIAIVAILLLGIAVSVFLSQRQQIFKSRSSLQAYNAFNVGSAEPGKYVSCSGNVCETNTLNITMSVADLQALNIQEQVARSKEPVVDDQSQNQALSSYFQSAAEVADREDQEFARERGLPDAQAQSVTSTLISTLEKGLDVPDELWQDYGSKLGNLSQGAVDLVTSQVQQAQEKGEQAKAQEELAKTEVAAAQQQEKITQALDKWSGMPALEKAEILREYYNLPPGTDPEQVLSFYDKAMTVGGVEFKSGSQASTVGPYGVHLNSDLSSFIITDTKGSVNEYLSVSTPDLVGIVRDAIKTGKDLYELYQAMPPEKAAEVYLSLTPEARDKINVAMLNGTKEVLGSVVQMLPFIGTNILSERVNGLNSNMAQIAEQLKDPNLTAEEREALKQDYFSSLNEIQDVKRDLVVNAAFDLVGGVPGSALAEKAAGKGSLAAKELFLDTKAALQAAKEAGKEGLEGVWVGGRQLATDERGSWDVFGLIRKEKPQENIEESIQRVLSQIHPDNFRRADGSVNLPKWEESSEKALTQIFGNWSGNKPIIESIAGKLETVPRDELFQMARSVDEAYDNLISTGWRIDPTTSPEVKQVIDAYQYDSRWARSGFPPRHQLLPKAHEGVRKAELLETLLNQNLDAKFVLSYELADIERGMRSVEKFSVAHGESPKSFSYIPEALDPSVIHIADDNMLSRVYGEKVEGLAGLYNQYSDKNILVKSSEQCAHECTHRLSDLANPNQFADLREVLGSTDEALRMADRLGEGATERFANAVKRFAGKEPEFVAFEPEVKAVDEIIAQVADNLHISAEQAEAKFYGAKASGRLSEFVKLAGPERAAEIMRNNPTRNPERFGKEIIVVTPLEKDLAIADALEDVAKLKGTGPKGNSGQLPWNLLMVEVFAQSENIDNSVLNSASFEFLVKTKLAKRALEANGRLDNRYIEGLLKKDIFAPEIIDTPDGLSIVTGKTGNVEGEIGEGRYLVNLDSMQDLDIKVPSVVEVKAGMTIVPVAIRKGSGKVEKTTGLSVGIGGGEAPKVKVAAFYDENGNGKWDGSEKALPWAGIKVTLARTIQEKTINLGEGWNLITLPALPTTPLTAKGLLVQIAKQGGSASTVSTLENGAWKSYVMQDNQGYSRDNFTLEPGKAYFVNASRHSTFSFIGQEFVSPVKLSLKQGWNAIGFPKISKQHKSGDLGANEDFIIEENRGYLLNLKKGIDFSP